MMFFRTQRFLIFSLCLFLGVLLLAKFVSPLYLKAQTASTTGSSAAGGGVSCQISDIFEYVAPKGNLTINASYIPASGTRHIGDLPNHIEYLNDTTFRQWSGSSNFIYAITGDTIRLAQDNVWGGQYCSTGAKAMYRLISNDGTIGSPQRKQSMSCGQSIPSDHKLQPYIYDPGVNDTKDPLHFSLNTCTVPGYESPLHTEAQLIYGGKAQCNPDLNGGLNGDKEFDVAVFKNTVGAGVGEIYVYCKGYGLCALYDKLDDSPKNQPSAWDASTDLCNLQGGEDKANYYEMNIQREDSQKVLNNFYDEYSVACLPKEEYTVGFENTQKCGQPNVYCPADWKGEWNIPGKLTLTADGKAYGLFRDEEAVKSRVNTNQPAKRTESIENYLDMPNTDPLNAPNLDPSDLTNHQAPIYSLTDFETQCDFVVKKLRAVEEMCKTSNDVSTYTTAGAVSPAGDADASKCGLNTPVVGTSQPYDQETMLTAFTNHGLTCHDLATSPKEEDRNFLADLLRVNVSLDTAYRPAFIVAVTTFDPPASTDNVTAKSDPQPETGGKFQVIDYLEVKIPAIATDFLPPEGLADASSDQMNLQRNSYQDPLMLTSNVLRTTEDHTTMVNQQLADRKLLREYDTSGSKPNGPIIGDNGNEPFFCIKDGKPVLNCDFPAGGTGDQYQDQLPKSLVEFINASAHGSQLNWDELPCRSDEAAIYGPANKEQIAEQAQTIIAQLKAQKVGPYTKKNDIGTKITANVKDVTKGGNITTNTELYFVTPQRYALKWAQTSFLSFLTLSEQNNNTNTADVITQVADPSKFSPHLRSELGKTLSGLEKKPAYEIIGSDTVTNPDGTTSQIPGKHDFDLRGLLIDTAEKPDSQSIFWKVAGQVASLPTRMMTLLVTPRGDPVNDYTLGCTGNYATENWLTGKCLKAANIDAANASGSAGTTTNICVETKIDDPATLADYQAKLNAYLSLPTSKSLWYAYYSGYRQNAIEYLFETTPLCGGGTQPCYSYVLQQAVANHINPYLAIAIALNEDGGLKAYPPLGLGPHWGCGLNPNPPPVIGDGTIENKLKCMIGAFNDYANPNGTFGYLNDDQALRKYGYGGGQKNGNLTKIIGMISNHTYAGKCVIPQ